MSEAVPCRAARCEYSAACYYWSAGEGVQTEHKQINTTFPNCFNHRGSCSSPFSPTWPPDLALRKTQSAALWHSEGISVAQKQLVKILEEHVHSTIPSEWSGSTWEVLQSWAGPCSTRPDRSRSPFLPSSTQHKPSFSTPLHRTTEHLRTLQQVNKAFGEPRPGVADGPGGVCVCLIPVSWCN